jgi:acetyl-CoA C-acetyltransferase
MSRSSEVAARNPIAWFPEVRTVAEIGEPTPSNRITAEPYTKRMNSFANVDQGSALLVTTLAIAQEAGLADQCIYPWAGASNTELVPVERKDLGASPALRAAAAAAFAGAGVGVEDVDFFDIYSCFPIAVELGAAAIDLELDDPRGLTQTGGMSFFGGPGNNYTSHGIAAVALKLREGGRLGYVSGNGGVLSKHSIGIYSNEAPAKAFRRVDTTKEQEAIAASALEVALEAYGTATVDGGTVVYGRDGAPASAPIIATLADGRRVVANASPETLPKLAGRTLVGETVSVSGTNPPLYSL